MKDVNAYVVILTGGVLSACASGGLVSSWTAPDAPPLRMTGEKVAAVVMIDNQASRRAAEDALARELTARGAEGVPMYTILPDAGPDDQEAARRAAEEAGIEGVVVMRPVRTEQEVSSSPAMYTGPAYGAYWGGYYGYGWGDPWSVGGEIRTDTIVSVETLVYSMGANELVWGGQSETTNPTNVNQLVRDTAEQVARELERQGLLAGSTSAS